MQTTESPTIEIPAARQALAVIALPLVIAGVSGLALLASGRDGLSGIAGGLSVATPGLVVVSVMAMLGRLSILSAPSVLVALSSVRLVAATGMGLALTTLFAFEMRTFWPVLLLAALSSLVFETIVSMSSIREVG